MPVKIIESDTKTICYACVPTLLSQVALHHTRQTTAAPYPQPLATHPVVSLILDDEELATILHALEQLRNRHGASLYNEACAGSNTNREHYQKTQLPDQVYQDLQAFLPYINQLLDRLTNLWPSQGANH